MSQPVVRQEERALGEILTELAQDMLLLFHQEVELARVELTAKLDELGTYAAYLTAAVLLALLALQALTATAVIALARLLPWWLATLVVAVVLGAAATLLLRHGLQEMKRRGLAPRETLRSLKEGSEWLQDQMS